MNYNLDTNIFRIGIIGGSGLNDVSIIENSYELDIDTPYGKPSDKLIIGKISNVECVLLARHNKKHNINPTNVNYRANMYALKQVGCSVVLATTACGSLNELYAPGDLVLIDDFIDRTTKRTQTYFDGTHTELFNGVCHVPMYSAFDSNLREILAQVASKCDHNTLKYHTHGTVVTIEGPRFSSRAESKMYKQLNAHIINMTTCPECVLANELGLPYASIALITDYDCWRDVDYAHAHVDVESVIKMFKANLNKLITLIVNSIPEISKFDWQPILKANQDKIKSSIL